MKKHRLLHRMATHKAQRHPSEVEKEVLEFLDYIRPILIEPNRDADYIYNMDQTPVWMAMDDKMTISLLVKVPGHYGDLSVLNLRGTIKTPTSTLTRKVKNA